MILAQNKTSASMKNKRSILCEITTRKVFTLRNNFYTKREYFKRPFCFKLIHTYSLSSENLFLRVNTF